MRSDALLRAVVARAALALCQLLGRGRVIVNLPGLATVVIALVLIVALFHGWGGW